MGTTKLLLDYDYDFLLIGILTSAQDYKLCWRMNRALGTNLSRQEDLEMTLSSVIEEQESPTLDFESPELNSNFSLFEFYDEVTHLKYTLVANKSKSARLIREEQSVDFFLLVDGLYSDYDEEIKILEKIKTIDHIITAYKIDPNQLKSKQNLIFE